MISVFFFFPPEILPHRNLQFTAPPQMSVNFHTTHINFVNYTEHNDILVSFAYYIQPRIFHYIKLSTLYKN